MSNSSNRIYWVWRDNTCWTCQQITGGATFHARQAHPFDGNRDSLSPCMTTPRKVQAASRNAALKLYRAMLAS